jgi:hypothetical protein
MEREGEEGKYPSPEAFIRFQLMDVKGMSIIKTNRLQNASQVLVRAVQLKSL